MDQLEKDTGTLMTLKLDLEENRLPRIIRILDKVNGLSPHATDGCVHAHSQ